MNIVTAIAAAATASTTSAAAQANAPNHLASFERDEVAGSRRHFPPFAPVCLYLLCFRLPLHPSPN